MEQEEGTSFAISLKDLQELLDNPPHARLSHVDTFAFIDFAFGGSDETVIAIRSGNRLEQLICWRDSDNMATVGRIIVELSRAGLKPKQVWGDEGGGGRVICNALSSAGWPINRFNFGARAFDDRMYNSRGAEIWVSFGRMVARREIVLLREEVLISQLTSRQTTFDMRGRTILERKDEMRGRGLKSPDRADAVVGVFGIGSGYVNSTNRHFVAASSDPMRALDQWNSDLEYDQSESASEWGKFGLSDPGG